MARQVAKTRLSKRPTGIREILFSACVVTKTTSVHTFTGRLHSGELANDDLSVDATQETDLELHGELRQDTLMTCSSSLPRSGWCCSTLLLPVV